MESLVLVGSHTRRVEVISRGERRFSVLVSRGLILRSSLRGFDFSKTNLIFGKRELSWEE